MWRRYRDFFYAPNMHGYDWEALRQRYSQLLPYVAHRTDLNYVISEMISELTVQHAYIDGGDLQIPPRPHAGLPGARFEVDAGSGRYRIARIFSGQNEEDVYRSPLTEIGVDAKVGRLCPGHQRRRCYHQGRYLQVPAACRRCASHPDAE